MATFMFNIVQVKYIQLNEQTLKSMDCFSIFQFIVLVFKAPEP